MPKLERDVWERCLDRVWQDHATAYSLLGILFLGKYFARNDEANEFDEQIWIQSTSTSSLFQCDHGKHQWHFKHGNTYLPELITNEDETYVTAFCTCISQFVDDKINCVFSLAFTTSPDSIPQHHIIQNDDSDKKDEVQWYTRAHVRQNEQSNKLVCFRESTKLPKPILHETPEFEFKLGMNIIFKDGAGNSKHVVYKGATANGLKHVIIHIDSS
jgi:hypothetical protein